MKAHVPWLALLLLLPRAAAAAGQPDATLVDLSQAMTTLTGPWRFHAGDDRRWADPSFDDSGWERVDLSAPASATDGDVGLPNYAPGWSAKGHPGYYGYAWYRIHLIVRAPLRKSLALLGPWEVESAYQVYENGRLLGGVGNFSGATPAAYGDHYPTLFALPPIARGDDAVVVAIRVWMGPWGVGPESGGVHIAPAIGERQAVVAAYRLQWLTIFEGYVGDAVIALLFFLAATAALCLQPFDRGGKAYPWLAAALMLSAIQRGNQAFFFWLNIETVPEYELFIIALIGSLTLGAWMMAWRAWLEVTRPAWLPRAVAVLTAVLFAANLLDNPWLFHVDFPQLAAIGASYAITTARLAFLLIFWWILYQGASRRGHEVWYALPPALAIGTVLFSTELAAAHVPGIWFPWGIGVSLSEYASLAFVLLLSVLLLLRLWGYAGRLRPARLV